MRFLPYHRLLSGLGHLLRIRLRFCDDLRTLLGSTTPKDAGIPGLQVKMSDLRPLQQDSSAFPTKHPNILNVGFLDAGIMSLASAIA
jgi:hypothetical protein